MNPTQKSMHNIIYDFENAPNPVSTKLPIVSLPPSSLDPWRLQTTSGNQVDFLLALTEGPQAGVIDTFQVNDLALYTVFELEVI